MSISRSKRAFVVWSNTILCIVVAMVAVSPVSGITISGVLVATEVKPGGIVNHRVVVANEEAASTAQIAVVVASVAQGVDGTFVPSSDPGYPFSAAQYISIEKTAFKLGPGQTRELNVTIQIPRTIGNGGRYAILSVKCFNDTNAQYSITPAVNIPVLLTIAGSEIVNEGEINNLSIVEPVEGKPIEITLGFKNTGNHHYKIWGKTTISDSSDRILDTIFVNTSGNSILPLMTRHLKMTFVPSAPLLAGRYLIKSSVLLEDGTVLVEANGVFDIKEVFKPPPLPATITLHPLTAATLATDDERISVNFPSGVVVETANIGLMYFPAERMPPPPSGMQMASTLFRLEGVNGLLAREATICVKYSTADLSAARDDVSRLVLGRWDDTSGKWITVRTKLDRETSTLKAATNQLGIWAIMVRESGQFTLPGIYLAVVSGILLFFITAVFMYLRKKPVKAKSR